MLSRKFKNTNKLIKKTSTQLTNDRAVVDLFSKMIYKWLHTVNLWTPQGLGVPIPPHHAVEICVLTFNSPRI